MTSATFKAALQSLNSRNFFTEKVNERAEWVTKWSVNKHLFDKYIQVWIFFKIAFCFSFMKKMVVSCQEFHLQVIAAVFEHNQQNPTTPILCLELTSNLIGDLRLTTFFPKKKLWSTKSSKTKLTPQDLEISPPELFPVDKATTEDSYTNITIPVYFSIISEFVFTFFCYY